MSETRVLRNTGDVVAIELPLDGGYALSITTPDRTIDVRRARPWTAEDVDLLVGTVGQMRKPELMPGEKRTTRRKHLHGDWWLYTHVNTGPPTWWWPRIKPERYGLMVGWLRGLVAVSVRRDTRQCDSCGTRGPVRYSPDHGAHFCQPCDTRENPSQPSV